MEGAWNKIVHSKSKTFLTFCFSFLAGVTSLSFVTYKFFEQEIFILFLVFLFTLVLFWKKQPIHFFLFAIIFFLLGMMRVNFAIPAYDANSLSFYNDKKQSIHGVIAGEPDIRQDAVHYIVKAKTLRSGGQWQEVSGKIAVKMPLYPRYTYGQNILIDCNLKTPQLIEGFHYEKYLATYGVWSVCEASHIQVESGTSGNPLLRALFSFKSKCAENISRLWHEPYASFVAGVLYGYRGGLGTLSTDFNRTGVTHIVAVSGFNITIIASVFAATLLYLLVPRKKAFWIVSFAILLFVLFTGVSGSAVRAAVMALLVLISRQLGRTSRMDNVLALTVALMSLFNPFTLIWDLGFQLSFLSTCGLVYLSPHLQKYFSRVPTFLNLQESVTATLAAMIFTLPLILFEFGRLSVIALLVNVLVVPVVLFIMAFGFATLFSSFIWWPLARALAFLTYLLLAYVVFIVRFFSHLSWAALSISLPLWGMIILYILLVYFLFRKNLKKV